MAKIFAPNSFLSAEEIVSTHALETKILRTGSKLNHVKNTDGEQLTLLLLLGYLRSNISYPRIARKNERSIAKWDPTSNTAIVIKKCGKLDKFGFTEGNILHLHKYEVLFLLEVNRLVLYTNSIITSIEQAYHMLLGTEKSINYDYYCVFCTLIRAGYNVKYHESNLSSTKTPSDNDIIWEILQKSLSDKHYVPASVINDYRYVQFKSSMINIGNQIKLLIGETNETFENCPLREKRKALLGDTNVSKRAKLVELQVNDRPVSFTNCVKKHDFAKLSSMFTKIEILEIKESEFVANKGADSYMRLPVFDLYVCKQLHKTNEPNFTVLVSRSSDKLPDVREIGEIYCRFNYKCPLLLVHVTESKNLQAFVYHCPSRCVM